MARNSRSRAAVRSRVVEPIRIPFWLAALTASGLALFGAGLAHGQSDASRAGAPTTRVPEVVQPRTESPTLPPTANSGTTPPTTSVTPQVDGGGAKPLPDTGVIRPPVTNPGTPSVITPPATGTMPVIPPPGLPGGEKAPVPK